MFHVLYVQLGNSVIKMFHVLYVQFWNSVFDMLRVVDVQRKKSVLLGFDMFHVSHLWLGYCLFDVFHLLYASIGYSVFGMFQFLHLLLRNSVFHVFAPLNFKVCVLYVPCSFTLLTSSSVCFVRLIFLIEIVLICVMFCRSLFVLLSLFLLTIVLSVLRFADYSIWYLQTLLPFTCM